MRLLLDHCVDRRLAEHLGPHEVTTAAQAGWTQLRNGALLAKAAAAGFDALVTTDANIKHQQNIRALPLTVIVLRAHTNRLADLLPMVPRLLEAVSNLTERRLVEIAAQ